ncbi:MAG: XisI protein [Pleurocapsa sp. SU_196_0]|nr:XisI protein [Pleurocapsa sp. SU_196_0]
MTQSEIVSVIETILSDIAQPGVPHDIEYQIITDTAHHHYQVVANGWRGMKRVFGIIVHIDIKDELVWVQEDNTDYGVAEALVRNGIPKERIVLGFHAPYKREYTGFATGE